MVARPAVISASAVGEVHRVARPEYVVHPRLHQAAPHQLAEAGVVADVERARRARTLPAWLRAAPGAPARAARGAADVEAQLLRVRRVCASRC